MTAYAAGRWSHVVRAFVLLGAPAHHAPALAAEAVSRLLDWRDDATDPDVALGAEVVQAWERDRTAWWAEPADEEPDLTALDVLLPADRARVALRDGLGLTAAQTDDVLGPALGPVPASAASVPAPTIDAVETGEPRLDEARSRRVARRRRRRRTAVGAVAAVAIVATAPVVPGLSGGAPVDGAATSPTPAVGDATPGTTVVRLVTVRTVPGTWYDGRRIHLRDRVVTLPDVVGMARLRGGVLATDTDGVVRHVRASGSVTVVGRTLAGQVAASDPGASTAAWVDPRGDRVVVRELESEAGSLRVDAPGVEAVVALDGDRVYVSGADLAGQPSSAGRFTVVEAPPGLLDAADGALLTTAGSDDVEVTGVLDDVSRVRGNGGTLSDGGRWLLTRDDTVAGSPPSRVVDLTTDAALDLPLPPATGIVTDAVLERSRVTFVLETRQGVQYPPDRPRSRGFQPGFTLVVCELATAGCYTGPEVFGEASRPLLAR